MATIEQFMSQVNRDVDAALGVLVPAARIHPKRLHEAIRWSLFAGGKRIRPGLVFASGETFGADSNSLSRTAAAIEMIHTFSLIHDDLPAMDDDDLRRGRATCHIKYGEATAILAGDALQTLAFKVIAEDEALTPEIRVRLIVDIASASGTPNGMVAGQQLDLDAEGHTVAISEIEDIHSRKTGALIAVSAKAGALIGGATDDEITAIENYASRIGLLFQITDDLLDVTQATEALGKTAGKDVAADKATYPRHFGVDGTRKMAETIREAAHTALAAIDRDTGRLGSLADLIAERTF
jgi:geranylgeranyl pyrophosphate synthase